MTKEMQKKLNEIKAVAEEGNSCEKWVDKDGTIIPINRCPIDWQKVWKTNKGRIIK